jgi:AraC-like DNA-binding protein
MLISRRLPVEPSHTGGSVSSAYLGMVAFGAEARGLAPAKIFRSVGIDPQILQRRGARVGIATVARAWGAIHERLGDPLFGLALVEMIPFGAADILDYLLRNCATAGESLELLCRFAPLMNDADGISLAVSGQDARLRLRTDSQVPSTCELVIGLIARRTREILGRSWALRAVSFTHAALGPRSAYDRVFQAPLRFGMPFNEIVFRRELLELPQPGADARLKNILLVQAEGLLATLAPPPRPASFLEQVEQALADGLASGDPSLSGLSDRLRLSSRTVQRRLRDAGLSHRDVVRKLRFDLAARSLTDPSASQRQIAQALGYSGAGAFHRAFKRWSGATPGQVRRRAQPPGAPRAPGAPRPPGADRDRARLPKA